MKQGNIIRKLMKAGIWFAAGAWTGGAVTQYLTFRQHPEISMVQSAPWYTGALLQGVVTAALILLCLAGRVLLKDEIGKEEKAA